MGGGICSPFNVLTLLIRGKIPAQRRYDNIATLDSDNKNFMNSYRLSLVTPGIALKKALL